MSERALWGGRVPNGDTYRVVSRDDSYGGEAESVEWLREDGTWQGVSYGQHADAPEVAHVAAHLARQLAVRDEQLRVLREAAREYREASAELIAAEGDEMSQRWHNDGRASGDGMKRTNAARLRHKKADATLAALLAEDGR